MMRLEDILFKSYRLMNARPVISYLARKLDSNTFKFVLLRRIYAHYHKIFIGEYSYGGCFNYRRVASGTRIGKFCSFAEYIDIFSKNHPLDAITLHPFIYNPDLRAVESDYREPHPVTIGSDVWMGQNAMIMPSVSLIGDGAVIAAGAVITKNVPPYAIVAGVPAQVIKYRFSENVINRLMEIKWWNWDPKVIYSLALKFRSVDEFLNSLNTQ
jgi:virginiamycin A acetyltransferase